MPAGFEPWPTPHGDAWRWADVVAVGPPPSPPLSRGEEITGFAYLDLETTGLSGGTGTYAWAAAFARRVAAGLEIVQLFLHEPAQEPAFLHAVREEIWRSSALGSYNGSRFDVPLLKTRWVMARMDGNFEHPPHLDLLTLTRALFGRRLSSCALRNVEERLLGFEREEDVAGGLLPDAYFEYLRRGSSPLLEPALAHNRQDVESLHHLHLRLESRLRGDDVQMEALDWLALGRVLERLGKRAAGWRALRYAAEMAQDGSSAAAGLVLAAKLSRGGRSGSAERLLAWLEERLQAETHLAIARARLLEWRLRDLAGALEVVDLALGRLDPGGPLADDLARRRFRLERKLQRQRRRQRDHDRALAHERAQDLDEVRVERPLQLRFDAGECL
jgi:hypothetical protein